MLYDPIADFLTRIRNAQKQKHRYVDVPISRQKLHIAKVLEEQGFLHDIIVSEENRSLRMFLKYEKNRSPVIHGLKRVSKPGLRRYVSYEDIPRILGGMGIAVLSTNKGILAGEEARKQKIGGELLCYIW